MKTGKKILVVEDELKFAQMLKSRLESVGYIVSIVTDAYAGTREILKNDFDLIVLDLMMPAGGGFSILERIRSFPGKSTIPVVILTGKTIDDSLKQMAESFNVEAIFLKPYNPEHFLNKINSLLNPEL